MILVRQLAGYLFVPALVVDTTGTVVFYNEPAERILGVRFEETGRIGPDDIDRLVELSDNPAAGPDEAGRPLVIALQQRRPAHARRWLLRRGDRVRLQVELHDAQYTRDEHSRHVGWGHSTIHDALAFARLAGVKHLVPFHHDPGRDDAALEAAVGAGIADLRPDFPVTPAAEGRRFDLR